MRRAVGLASAVLLPAAVLGVFWLSSGPVDAAGSSPQSSSSADPSSPPEQLRGSDLAQALGLNLVKDFPAGCRFFVQVDNPAGYCLDELGSNKADLWVIAQELQGKTVSDAELAFFKLANRLSNMSTDDPEYLAVWQQLQDARTTLLGGN